ncbi:3',5'-cyclic-nucleotide phosphodiesterase [Methylobacterium oxalidis]|uniref:3',5'-cyclic-nucleotide phosphodiesterase n=1 Tax=Methylobacterium oxalidis TaxID=944322 RepID=UPI003314A07A
MASKLTSLALALGFASALAAPALADPAPQTKRGNETLKKYCTGDYLTYCGNLAPEDPATDACFETNWKKLSENCRRAIDAYQRSQPGAGNKKG